MTVDIIRSKGRKKAGPRPVYEFGLEFYRGEVAEVHTFRAYAVLDAGSLSYTLSAGRKPERAIEGLVRTIRKMLADDDGTPVAYRPTRYVEPRPDVEPEFGDQDDDEEPFGSEAVPDIEDDEEEDDDAPLLGPDGEPHDSLYIQEALKIENGSSRRRFAYLMDDDEDLTLEVDQLETVYRKLVGRAANRPTGR